MRHLVSLLLSLSLVLTSVTSLPTPEADEAVTPLSVTPEVPALDTVDEVTSVSEPEPEAESEPTSEEPEAAKAEPEPETQSKAEPEPEAESEPEPEAESEPESEPYPESDNREPKAAAQPVTKRRSNSAASSVGHTLVLSLIAVSGAALL